MKQHKNMAINYYLAYTFSVYSLEIYSKSLFFYGIVCKAGIGVYCTDFYIFRQSQTM